MRHVKDIQKFVLNESKEIQDIRFAFEQLNLIMTKVNESYLLITENYGAEEAELFEAGWLSGFKDKVAGWGQKAGQAGHAIGQAANTANQVRRAVGGGIASDFRQAKSDATNTYNKAVGWAGDKFGKAQAWAKDTYNKGAQYADQALQIVKDACSKIVSFFASAWQKISSAPGEFWEQMKQGWGVVVDKLAEMKERAGDKFQLEAGLILEDLNKKLCKKLRELTGDMQMGEYAIARKRPAEFFGKYAKFKGTLLAVANELISKGQGDAKAFGNALLDVLEKGATSVGLFIIGLIIAPFFMLGWAGGKLINLGISFADVVQKFIVHVKTEVPEIWSELKGVGSAFSSGFKSGYNNGNSGEAVKKESHMLRFEDFGK